MLPKRVDIILILGV